MFYLYFYLRLLFGRISEESAEFFERVNGIMQKQENMLRGSQAEVTLYQASTFPSVFN